MSPLRPAPLASLVGCAALAIAVSGLAPPFTFAETTQYEVTFQATWSAQTHPIDFPANPHFSGLVGGMHSDQVSFWDEGQLASDGIEIMAELGGKATLIQEVQAAIGAGTADVVLSGGGIGVSPGSVSMAFTADDAYPLVTLVSMLAPSPDWFVGVSGLSLRDNGAWIPQVVVDLVVWDAGTDSGVTYTAPNFDTVPPDPITEKTDYAFASNHVVGTFTFTRTDAVGVAEGLPQDGQPLLALGPNPLRASTRFQIRVPNGLSGDLAVYDVRGQRVRNLFRGRAASNVSVIAWDGHNESGAPVASGVYYVALRVEGLETRTEKVVVAR